MSQISEFMEQEAETPGPRRGNITSVWDCFTTASKTATKYRSQMKSTNRLISFVADIIASSEEFEHPESRQFITRVGWNVHRVSPLWNLKFKSKKDKNNLDDSEFTLAEGVEYDEAALKRYATLIRGFLMDDCADMTDNPCSVEISSLPGLRGSRNDKDALKIEVCSVLGRDSRTIFIGVLCGVESCELQISSSNATVLPVFLAAGSQNVTDRVIHGLTKCFDCVVTPLLFSDYELLWASALWTGLEPNPDRSQSTVDCTIQPRKSRRPLREKNANNTSTPGNDTTLTGKDKTSNETKGKGDIVFIYSVPDHLKEIKEKLSSITITLDASEVKELWRTIHKEGETEFTETEMMSFHSCLNLHIKECLGLYVDKLTLEETRLPYVSVSRHGKIKIHHQDHVKVILRHLTMMCQGDMLRANPTLGVPEESYHAEWS